MDIVTWPYTLRRGHSKNPAKGACAMDAVNWLVHGKHGDHPRCTCPVIAAYVRAGNDGMPDGQRQRLLPYLFRIAGSRSPQHEAARTRVFFLGAVRLFAPYALEIADRHDEAARLRDLPDDLTPEAVRTGLDDIYKSVSKKMDKIPHLYPVGAAIWSTANVVAWAALQSIGTQTLQVRKEELPPAMAKSWPKARKSARILARQSGPTVGTDAARAASQAAHAAWGKVLFANPPGTWQPGTRWKLPGPDEVAVDLWDQYLAVLDAALNTGPQGEPWSADHVDHQVALFDARTQPAPA